ARPPAGADSTVLLAGAGDCGPALVISLLLLATVRETAKQPAGLSMARHIGRRESGRVSDRCAGLERARWLAQPVGEKNPVRHSGDVRPGDPGALGGAVLAGRIAPVTGEVSQFILHRSTVGVGREEPAVFWMGRLEIAQTLSRRGGANLPAEMRRRRACCRRTRDKY